MKQATKDDKEARLRFVFEDRMRLQSTQRYLDLLKIPHKKFEYFISKDFKSKYFAKWDAFKRKNFLEKLVGRDWKQFQEMLEKE